MNARANGKNKCKRLWYYTEEDVTNLVVCMILITSRRSVVYIAYNNIMFERQLPLCAAGRLNWGRSLFGTPFFFEPEVAGVLLNYIP